MTFGGIPNEKQRADIIAYLNSNSDNPLPLPKAADAGAAANPPANAPAIHLPRRRRPSTCNRTNLPIGSARGGTIARGCEVHFVAARGRHAGAAFEKHIISGVRLHAAVLSRDCDWSTM